MEFSDYIMPRWSIELYSFLLVFWVFSLFPLLSVELSYFIPRVSIELYSFGFIFSGFFLILPFVVDSAIRGAKDGSVDKINKWIKARYVIQHLSRLHSPISKATELCLQSTVFKLVTVFIRISTVSAV